MSPTEEKLHAALDAMLTRDDFVGFVGLLVESFDEPGPAWDNSTLKSYLRALAEAARKLEQYYDSSDEAVRNVASPSWEAVAGLLFTARCGKPGT